MVVVCFCCFLAVSIDFLVVSYSIYFLELSRVFVGFQGVGVFGWESVVFYKSKLKNGMLY